MKLAFFLAILLSTQMSPINACLKTPSRGGGATVPATTTAAPPADTTTTTTITTTTSDPCPTESDRSYLFVANDVTFESGGYTYSDGTSCKSCSSGSEEYWTPGTSDTFDGTVSAGTLDASNCADFCACATAGNCYTLSSSTSTVTMYPYCDAGVCSMYIILGGDGVRSSAGFLYGSDIQYNLGILLPVTDSAFPKVASVSCSGCPITTCTTTTTPTDPCPTESDRSYLFVANGVTFVAGNYQYQEGTSCHNCASGSEAYWTPGTDERFYGTVSAGTLSTSNCEDFCGCDADGICYTLSTSTSRVTLYPYCDEGVCSMYLIVRGSSDTDGVTSTTGVIYQRSDQFDSLGNSLPVTGDTFPKIVSVSCSGCPITTCS